MKKQGLKRIKVLGFWLLLLMGFYLIAQFATGTTTTVFYPSWNELEQEIRNGNIQEVSVTENTVVGFFKEYEGTEKAYFEAYIPSLEIFYNLMDEYAQDAVENYPPPKETSVLVSMLPTLLLAGALVVVWFFIMNQNQGGGGRMMNFGKSRARTYDASGRKVTFKDVAGVNEEKEELAEIVEFLKSPKRFTDLGARVPKGVLLTGPPGTGKTLLARAVAGEAGVPFFSISGSDFVEMFVGVGASRVRDLFEQAKKNAPCIIFMDEIDAVGRQRGAGLGGGHDEREQTLNQLLVEMDGFDSNLGIIMIAATNRPDILDPALLRPGRFDRQIVVNVPDVKGRYEILKIHGRNKPLAADVDLKTIAKGTAGFTGAELENLFNESALLAARRGRKDISMDEMQEAITRVIAGPAKKSRVMTKHEKKLTAYHEAGHAIVAHHLPNTDPVHEVSIIPRGRAGGYTLVLPKEDRSYQSKTELLEFIKLCMGGRAAEELFLQDISTGAVSDIDRATNIAKAMVRQYGMSNLGPISFGNGQNDVFLGRDITHTQEFGPDVVSRIDQETIRIIEECHQTALNILEEHRDQVIAVAEALLEKESIDGEEFLMIVEPEKYAPQVEEVPAEEAAAAEVSEGPVAEEAAEPEQEAAEFPAEASEEQSE